MRTLVFLVGLCAIALAHRADRLDSIDVKPFRGGNEYIYRYDAQVAAGLSPQASEQKAATRIEAKIKLAFHSDEQAVLRMQDIGFGQLNEEVEQPQNMKPMRSFEQKSLSEEQRRQLQLPAQIHIQDGAVKRINFHEEDNAWSKNIKRGVINLIHLNLNRQNTDSDYEQSQETEYEKDKTTGAFVQKEITLEGKCKVAYTVNKAEQKQQSDEEERRFNVTKAINFAECSEVADVAYGFHSQEIQSWCTQALKTDEQEKKDQPRRLCDTKEVKERKVDRSSVFRYTLSGKPSNYGIERAEVISQYIGKSLNAQSQQAAGQIVVVAQLTYEESSQTSSKTERVSGKEESLMYNAEQETEEKRFYMYGDEEFSRQSPFEEIANKAGLAKQIAHRMLESWQQHIDTDATLQMSRLVDVLRMSTVSELNKIWKTLGRGNTGLALKSDEQEKLEQVFQDALAIAGTRNTVHTLVEKIINGEIPTEKAVQTMKSLAGVPAPSEKLTKEVERLCKSEVSRSSAPLKQSCWLAYGSLIGDLCREKPVQAKQPEEFETEKLCPRETKEHFQKTLMEQYKSAESTYEKILALKALGNAALDIAVNELQEIIKNQRQEPVIRIQAIDSLRRLRHQMPHKIHRMLLPVFENTREQPEVRMAAFSMIMHTLPEKSIIDKLAYALMRERSENVKSFVYTTAKALAKSTIPAEKELANHLENVLKMVKIEGENLRSSRQYRVPIYSEEHNEGIFLNMASMVSTRNALPAHLAARMDLLLNEELERNAFEVHLSQQDVERWYEKALELFSEGTARPTRGQRNQRRGSDQLRSMHSERGYKSRRSQIGSEEEREQPFGMLCVRFGDVDHVILPAAEQYLPRSLKNVLQGEKPKLSELLDAISVSKQFRMASAMVFGERKAMIPTSIGLPLRFKQSAPVLAYVHGSVKIDASIQRPTAQLRLHTVATPVYSQKMEVWCPVAASGITIRHSAELHLPIDVQAEVEKDQLKISVKLPQQKQTLVTVHTLPATYTVDAPEKSEPQREKQLLSIHSRRVEHQQQEVDYDMTKFGMPLSLKAHYYRPSKVSYRDIVNVFTFTQNTIRVEYEPSSQTPEQIEFQASWSLFEKASAGKLELNDFYRDTKFDEIYSSEETDSMELDNQNERSRKLNKFLDSYKPTTMYKHNLKMSAKTIGGRRQHQVSMEIKGQCEPRMTYCKVDLKTDANRDWQMNAQLQTLLPEAVKNVEQLEQLSEKQKHFVAKMKAEWGTGKQQQLTVSVQGEPALTRHQRQIEQQIATHRPQFKSLTRFVNKFDLEATYTIGQQAQNYVNKIYEALKAYYYWSSSTELKDGRDGTIHVSAIIDPITRRHANLTVKTPTERVRFQSMELPMHTRPMPFIRRQSTPKHSVAALISALSHPISAECRVENHRVRTFDDVIYNAALPKCFTAVAKDCTSEEPRFAVLMKRISEDNQDKKLKVITEEAVIEVKPKGDSLYVKVNDERMSEDWEEQARLGIHMEPESNEIVIEVPGATVRFDGQEASVSVSAIYKNGLCGLCGHYDEEGDDELRMKNNELTSDLKEFHRSYVHPTEDECTNDEFESFYVKQKFQPIRRQEWDSQEDDSDEYYAESGRPRRQHQKWRKQNDDDSQEKPEPIEKTEVMEYHNKICFSMKPVKKCPQGTDVDETTEKTVPFKCFQRSSIQAQRMLKQARNGDVLDLAAEEQSLSHSVNMARTCVPAY